MSNLTDLFTDIADAIRDKKGTAESIVAETFPSEIASIETGASINGGIETTALAKEDIKKGDVLALTNAASGYETSATVSFPATAIKGTSSVDLSGDPVKLDNEGKFIVIHSTESGIISDMTSYKYYPFCLVNGAYQQMTYNGTYTSIASAVTLEPANCYDTITNNMLWTANKKAYMLHINFDTLDIEVIDIPSASTQYIGYGVTFAHGNIFISEEYNATGGYFHSYFYKYDATANTLTRLDDIGTMIGNSGSYGTRVIGYKTNAEILYLALWSKYGNNAYATLYIAKFFHNVITGGYAYQSKVEATNALPTASGYINRRDINTDFTQAIYIHYSTKTLTSVGIDITTMTKTEMALTFSDGLDLTKVDMIRMVKNSNLIYVKSTDTTNYTTAELVRLYELDEATGVYNFVCCPAVTFSPVTASNVLPPRYNLINGEYTPYQKSDGTYSMYKVGYAAATYAKEATPCSNTLVENASGYGIANEDIATDEVGTITMILEAK